MIGDPVGLWFFNYDPSARANSRSSLSFKSDTTQNDIPPRIQ